MTPKNWKPQRLKELGFAGRGKSKHRPRNEPSLYGGNYPFVQTGDIKAANLYLREYSQTYNDKGLAQSKLWKAGTLCITIAANIAETAILGMEACFPDSVVGFVADENKSDVRFIKYYIDTIKLSMQNISQGTTQDNLSLEKLNTFDVLTPPLLTQHRIADILSAYDDLIENNTRRIRILEQMAQAIYQEWFGKVDKESLPKGWEVRKLSELVDTQYGYTESTVAEEVGPKYLRGMDINKSSFIQWSEVPFCPISDEDLPKYKLNVDDIVIIRMADPGKVGIVEKEVNAVFASYLIRLKITSSKLSPYFLFYYLLSDKYQGYITGASTGTTRKSASAGVITDVEMIIPADNIRQEFEKQISDIRKLLNNLLERNANLRQTRDLLLPRLVSGEVEVEELENA